MKKRLVVIIIIGLLSLVAAISVSGFEFQNDIFSKLKTDLKDKIVTIQKINTLT